MQTENDQNIFLDGRMAFSPGEAARLLGVGRTLIHQALKAKELDSCKLGGRRVIPLTAIQSWLAKTKESGK